MPSLNWQELIFQAPLSTFKIAILGTGRSVRVLVQRLLATSRPHVLSLSSAIRREWLGLIFVLNPKILYSPPPGSLNAGQTARHITQQGFSGYIVPGDNCDPALQEADAVVLFAHGGGMIFGHPLQYLADYLRWSEYATAKEGTSLVFLAVQYPLSTNARWPAQRDSMLAAYKWLLARKVSPEKVIFAGDSAGGNLAALTLMHIRDSTQIRTPLPASLITISPWFDMSASQTLGSANAAFDFLLQYDDGAPVMNNLLRPEGTEADTPQISALLHKDVGNLPPQLLIYSTTELLSSDSQRWYERCRKSGVDIQEFKLFGEMHTFAMGWPITSKSVQHLCDEVICRFITKTIRGG